MASALKDLASSITGNVPKAILYVRKPHDPTESANDGMALLGTLDYLSGGNADYLQLSVQYNPSSIHMQTTAGKQISFSGGNMGTESANQLVQVVHPVSTTMSLQLIFDDMNVQDAFMMQNLNPTVGNVVSGVADIVKKATKGVAYSVQKQMDGLIALLVRPETRMVKFCWADMSFQGELTGVDARYTMFNKNGDPIRGEVGLTIRQGNDNDANGYDESVPAYWDKAFNKLFGGLGVNSLTGGASKLTKMTQNNLLNLNL